MINRDLNRYLTMVVDNDRMNLVDQNLVELPPFTMLDKLEPDVRQPANPAQQKT